MTESTAISCSRNRYRELRLDSLCESETNGRSPEAFRRCRKLALRERVKELQCFYGISRLVAEHRESLPDLLREIVHLLPPSWQYPEICRARLTLYDQYYETEGFRPSFWVQAAPIRVRCEVVGLIEVVYLDETPEWDNEGPFLEEERVLIDAIAERVGKIVERFQAECRLREQQSELMEANAALKKVLARIEEEKAEVWEAIQTNVEKILMPTLRAMTLEIPPAQQHYVTLLQNQLNEFASPFVNRVTKSFSDLTPAEIEICDLVRSGMSTKDIARIRHVAPATISKQRARIRRKLGIAQSNRNLTTHLHTLISEGGESSDALSMRVQQPVSPTPTASSFAEAGPRQ